MTTPGGPLLSVADMLRDLSEDSSSAKVARKSPSSSSTSPFAVPPASIQKPKLRLEEQGLLKAFEETYEELDLALQESGHKWTGLTQELCATLTTADKLVATAHSNLGQLSQEVKRLEEIVERGQDAILKLQTNIGQNKNIPLPREVWSIKKKSATGILDH